MCSKKESLGRPASRVPGPGSGQEQDGGKLPFSAPASLWYPTFLEQHNTNPDFWGKKGTEGRGGSGMLVKLLKRRAASLLHFKL